MNSPTAGPRPGVQQVRVVRLPLNVNPTLALTGNTLDTASRQARRKFRILIVLSQESLTS